MAFPLRRNVWVFFLPLRGRGAFIEVLGCGLLFLYSGWCPVPAAARARRRGRRCARAHVPICLFLNCFFSPLFNSLVLQKVSLRILSPYITNGHETVRYFHQVDAIHDFSSALELGWSHSWEELWPYVSHVQGE